MDTKLKSSTTLLIGLTAIILTGFITGHSWTFALGENPEKEQSQADPVIFIDFTHISFQTPQTLEMELNIKLKKIGKTFNISLDQRRDYQGKFEELIEKLSQKERVAILIDEYDKPIINFIETEEKESFLKHYGT